MVDTELCKIWCVPCFARLTSLPDESVWDDCAVVVRKCASRVGGYSMLGFKASDLAELEVYAEGENVPRVI